MEYYIGAQVGEDDEPIMWSPGEPVYYFHGGKLHKIETSKKIKPEYWEQFYSIGCKEFKRLFGYGGISLGLLYKSPEHFIRARNVELEEFAEELKSISEQMEEVRGEIESVTNQFLKKKGRTKKK